MKHLFIVVVIACFFIQTSAQNIAKIDSVLDNVDYDRIVFSDYGIRLRDVKVPQATKDRVLAILNGYLPPQTIAERSSIPRSVLERLGGKAKILCGEDSVCYKFTIDSMTNSLILENIESWKTGKFSEDLILAIGHWNVKEALPILWENKYNRRYPRLETILAMAKLGENRAKRVVWNNIKSGNLSAYEAGIYLRNKKMLVYMVDDWDNLGVEIWVNDIKDPRSPDAMNFWYMQGLFDAEWDAILRKYQQRLPRSKDNNVSHEQNNLSPQDKLQLKKELKRWIRRKYKFD